MRGSLALSAAVLTVSVLSGCGSDTETAGATSANTYSVETELGTFEAPTDAGLTFAPPAEGTSVGDGGYVETSLELLPGSLGDHIFVYSTEEGVLDEVAAAYGKQLD